MRKASSLNRSTSDASNFPTGSRVLHQVPEGSITPSSSPSALRAPLFSFDSVTSYLIPTQQFCDRLLTFCVNHYRVIGYPVCIREGKYSRNEFIFNWALVIEEGLGDWVAMGEVVRKVGRLLRGLEEQGGFVSTEEDLMGVWEDEGDGGMRGWRGGGGSKVFAMCEMLLEDLNNYAECMIPIGTSSTGTGTNAGRSLITNQQTIPTPLISNFSRRALHRRPYTHTRSQS